jgi:hypothetical protein
MADRMFMGDDRRFVKLERWLSVAIGLAGVCGIPWTLYKLRSPPDWELSLSWVFGLPIFWVPLWGAMIHIPFWTARWVNRGNRCPKFRLRKWPNPNYGPPKGVDISIDVDLRDPVKPKAILSRTRQICASRAVYAVVSLAVLLIGWLAFPQPPLLLTNACFFAILFVWDIYPRAGTRYRESVLVPHCLVRSLCLNALSRGLHQGELPIQDWHPTWFDIIRTPSDGSQGELAAASWIYTYALLKGDLETATRYIERSLDLLPDNMPVTQYVVLGDALYFHAVVALDESNSKLLVERIHNIGWDLPARKLEYIESAIALSEGRRSDALLIAEAKLDRVGPTGGSAWIQLQRELLSRCSRLAS